MEYYSVIKNKESLPFGTIWMELEGIKLSEISQTGNLNGAFESLITWEEKKKLV